MIRPLTLAAILALAAGAAAQADTTDTAVFKAIKTDAGRALFERNCRRCHAVNAEASSYGPLLDGVVGRQAGTVEGYPYSEALKGAHFVWTPGALRAWMEDNDVFVPGTKMRHVGIDDPTVQDFIVTYLQSTGK